MPERLIAGLRAWLARPFPVSAKGLPWVLGAILVAFTAFLVAINSRVPDPMADRPAPAQTPPAAVAPVPSPPAEPEAPPTDALRDAKRAARRFVRGYVEYSYGRLDARRIPAADPALRTELAASPPRVPPAVARRHPHVDRVTTEEGATATSASFLAVITDESTVRVTCEFAHGQWRVVSIG